MDRSTTIMAQEAELDPLRIRDGFPGQRMRVLPRPLVRKALTQDLTRQLLVTDAGFFPHASHHWRSRQGAQEAIIIHCAGGRGTCRIGGSSHTIGPGQALVIPPGMRHGYGADPADPWTIWWAHLAGEAVQPMMRALGDDGENLVFDISEPAKVTTLLDAMLRRLETDESAASLLAATGAAWHLFGVIIADRRTVLRGRSDPIGEVKEYLRANIAQHISVTELAAMAGFSVSHFSALFRKNTGYGALEYQTRLRMSMARQLLDTTERTVASIAKQVGYEDPMYFSRQFRRIHHASPTQYRAKNDLTWVAP